MANKSLFSSITSVLPRATTVNEAGGPAYKFPAKHALAQLAATGTFGNVFYATASDQLDQLRKLIDEVDDNEFLAKLAVYSRERAYMKDMPAALLVTLSTRDTALMHKVFDRVADNGRVLRTVFQMVRSGQFGRKGLSSSLQRAFQRWLNEASTGKLLSSSIGNDPSLRDVLRMARPTPKDNARRALFGWLTDKEVDKWAPATEADLPAEVQSLKAFRDAETEEAQALIAGDLQVRWDLLADTAKGPLVWKAIARQMGPQALRMNLNTLLRHDVFKNGNKPDNTMIDYVAGRIADPEAIRRSRQFPYQFLAAYLNAADEVPHKIKSALHDAAEIACGNIPQLPAPVIIGLDTSGSMGCSVTGWHGRGRASKMRCVDVAALFAAAILRRNPDSVVVPFDTQAYKGEDRSKRFDPEPVGATVEVRWRRNGCVVAVGRGQQAVRKAYVCWNRPGQRQRKLDQLGTCLRIRSRRFDWRHDRMGEVQEDSARTRHRRSEVGLHRHRPLRQHASTRSPGHPEHRRLQRRRLQRRQQLPRVRHQPLRPRGRSR